jgi:alcohol dehydrogenase class IV
MFSFRFQIPTRLSFEPGGLSQLPSVVKQYGDRALIIVGRSSMEKLGVLDQVDQALRDAGIITKLLTGVKRNPTVTSIEAGVEIVKENDLNVIVALGGGSVMDVGRIVSFASTNEGDFWECRVTGPLSVAGIGEQTIPLVTVPTTAGTGAELSPAALIAKGTSKEVFFSPNLFPKAAVVDPLITLSIPSELSVEIGIDAFVQGMEAFVSREATPFSDSFAVQAMELAVHNLRRLIETPDDPHVRSCMSLAAIFSLFAINQAGVGAVHALSDPLSGRYDISHGLALASVLVNVVEFNCKSQIQKFARIAQILGADITGQSDEQAARAVGFAAANFLRELGLLHTMRELSVPESDIPVLAHEAQNPDMSSNPVGMSAEDIEYIYRRSF